MKVWSAALRRQGEAPRCNPCRDEKKTLRVALIVFISCNLVLALTKAHRHLPIDPRHEKPSPAAPSRNGARPQVEPVGFILSRVSTVVMAYLSAAACGRDGRALGETLSQARRTWRRPAATLLCIELLATAFSSLLWMLSALTRATRGAAAEVLFLSASAALTVWLVPVLFAHSEIACKLSLLVAVEEEGCEGMEALRRAGELVEGRKVQGFVLTTLLAQLEQAASAAFVLGRRGGGEREALANAAAAEFMGVALHLVIKFLSCLAYTKFYQECKKNHGHGDGVPWAWRWGDEGEEGYELLGEF